MEISLAGGPVCYGQCQRFGYFAGNVVLDHEDVVQRTIVGFRPDNIASLRTDQTRSNALQNRIPQEMPLYDAAVAAGHRPKCS